MLPPVGAIIVGPCPECKGLVVVFCGQVLALNKEVMFKGSIEEQKDHLMDVLTRFLQERITELVNEEAQTQQQQPVPIESKEADPENVEPVHPTKQTESATEPSPSGISNEDVEAFVNMELKLIDNSDYFKAIFG